MSLGRKHRARPVVDGGLLDRQQAAARLGISTSMLDKLRARGEGPPEVRLGDAVRFREISLDQFAAKREVA